MGLNRVKGQISIFLVIILLAVILAAGTAVDISRMAAGEAEVRRTVKSGVRSALSEYSTRLKEEYGILSTSKSDFELKAEIKSEIEKNLLTGTDNISNSEKFNLFDFRVEEVEVTPLFNLTENEVMRSQIIEYMKYRAPKEMIENTWDKLTAVKNAGKMAEAYKKKISVDKLLDKMGKAQQDLKMSLDGTIGDGVFEDYFVNGFNKNGSRDELVSAYSNLTVKHNSLLDEMAALEKEAERIGTRLDRDSSDETKAELRARLADVISRLREINSSIYDIKREMDHILDTLYNDYTDAFTEPNNNALEYIDGILDQGEKTGMEISLIEDFLENNFDEGDTLTESFLKSVQEDIKNDKELILDGKSADAIKDSLQKNVESIEKLKSSIDKVSKLINGSSGCSYSKTELVSMLTGGPSGYDNNIDYSFIKSEKEGSAADPRDEMSRKGVKAIQSDGGGGNLETAGIVIEDLPSRKKKISNSFEAEDSRYLTAENYSRTAEHSKTGADYTDELSTIQGEINFSDQDSIFTENAMDFMNVIGEMLTDSLVELRDEIYVNEYIIGTFKNSVNSLNDADGEHKDLDLRGMVKSERETFFGSEVEYILHGNKSESVNRTLTKGQVLLVRFAMNALHVYTDKAKKTLATGIASVIAGWWTAGAGVPVIANLIMCGWGMGEAVIDLDDLMKGKSVPFFKARDDWRLDIGLPLEEEAGKHSPVLFSYFDYLRLFLILKTSETKINRIEDLIQINMQKRTPDFVMADCSTYIRAEVKVSMRCFFISPMFLPEEKKTDDGRFRFEVLVYDGY